MHQDIHGLAIMVERQTLSAKAARGWEAEQVQPDSSFRQSLLTGATRILSSLRTINVQAPANTSVRQRAVSKRLIDMLPTE